MKTRLVTFVCALALLSAGANPCAADTEKEPLAVIADVVVVRPACFLVTAVGSVAFVVCLPFAAISKSVKQSADTLVVKPAKATFTRPLGDMEALTEMADSSE
jgi:hypothetical protein